MHIKSIGTYYRYISVLSIDITAGSLAVCYLFACFLNVTVPIVAYASLGLTVWLIYTWDHLLDVYRHGALLKGWRHQFHDRNFRWLLGWAIAGSITLMIMIWYLPDSVFWGGLILGGAVLLYFLLLHVLGKKYAGFPKEVVIAVMYGLGTALAPWMLSDAQGWYELGVLLQVMSLALMNLIMFTLFEHRAGEQRQLPAFLGHKPSIRVHRVMHVLALINFLISILYLILPALETQMLVQALMLTMTTAMLLIYWHGEQLIQKERYRMWGDLVFVLPVLLKCLG